MEGNGQTGDIWRPREGDIAGRGHLETNRGRSGRQKHLEASERGPGRQEIFGDQCRRTGQVWDIWRGTGRQETSGDQGKGHLETKRGGSGRQKHLEASERGPGRQEIFGDQCRRSGQVGDIWRPMKGDQAGRRHLDGERADRRLIEGDLAGKGHLETKRGGSGR